MADTKIDRRHLYNSSESYSYLDEIYNTTKNKIPEYIQTKKIIISDCDGILTDGRSYFSKNLKYLKSYGSYDKEAIAVLLKLGWRFLFVSHDDSDGLAITCSRIKDLQNKFKVDEDILDFQPLSPSERRKFVQEKNDEKWITVFIGDSLSDIGALDIATIAGTTNNAPDIVKEFCNVVSNYNGGQGGLGDILLTINGNFVKNEFDFTKFEKYDKI